MRSFVTVLLLTTGLLSGRAVAGSAVFSQDETSIYLIDNQKEILQLDLGSGQPSKPAVPKEIRQGQINELGRSNSGNILILQGDDLLSYDPTANKAVSVFSFQKKLSTDGSPEKWSLEDFAYNPIDGSILLFATGGENTSLWYLPKDEKHARPVFIRRVDSLEGMSFSLTGQLFFGYRGDLWCGSIASDPEGAGGKPPEHIYYLNAIRLAPVATLETDEASPSAQGVQVTAPGPERIYLHSLRLGGSGFGTILSVAAPKPTVGMVSPDQNADDDRSYFGLDKRLELYKAELASAQYYAENGSESFLCISGSGKKVFYRGSEKGSKEVGLYLIETNQPPRKVAPDLK